MFPECGLRIGGSARFADCGETGAGRSAAALDLLVSSRFLLNRLKFGFIGVIV